MLESAGAVGDRILRFGLHLAEGERLAVGDEDRIIAETVVPARRPDDVTVNLALEKLRLAVGPGQAQHGDEVRPSGLALPCMPRRHLLMHALHGNSEVPLRAGPVGRMHARRPIERVDLYPRLSASAGNPEPFAANSALICAFPSNVGSGSSGYGKAERARGDGIEAIRRDELIDLPHLAGVVARDDEAVAALQAPCHAIPQMRGSANSRQLPAGSRK